MKPKTLYQIEQFETLLHLYIGLDQCLYERESAIEFDGLHSIAFQICDKNFRRQLQKVIEKEETVLSLAQIYSLRFIPKHIWTKRRSVCKQKLLPN